MKPDRLLGLNAHGELISTMDRREIVIPVELPAKFLLGCFVGHITFADDAEPTVVMRDPFFHVEEEP